MLCCIVAWSCSIISLTKWVTDCLALRKDNSICETKKMSGWRYPVWVWIYK